MSQRSGGPVKNDVFQRIADRLFGGDRGLTLVLFWVGLVFVPWLSILVLVVFGILPGKGTPAEEQAKYERRRQAAENFKNQWTNSQTAQGRQSEYARTGNAAGAAGPRYAANTSRAARSAANPKVQPAPSKPAQPQKPELRRPKHTGDEQADDVLNVGYDFLVAVNELLPDIADMEVRAKAQTTCAKVRGIMDWIQDQPKSAERAKRLTTYYLPTTQKLLHTYISVDDAPGPNAKTICAQISSTLDTLNQALTNLMDDLLGNTAMDVEAEIAAMEQMLGSEGLTDDLRMPNAN